MKRLNLSLLTAICLLVSQSLFAQRNPTLLSQVEGPPYSQNITFEAPGDHSINEGSFSVTASTNSPLALYFEVSNTDVVSWTGGNNFQINGAGTCSIIAKQDGNDDYFPATPQEQSVTITKLDNEVNFDALPTATYGDLPYSISSYASASSGVYNFTTSDPDIAYVTDEGSNLLVIMHAGTVTISANFPETETYNGAESISHQITINKADHMVHYFESIGTKTYGDTPFELVAASTSGETVVFESSNPEIASVEGTTVTIHKGGTVSIIGGVPESRDYNTATPYEQSLTIDKLNQTISFDPLAPVYLGDEPFTLTGTASSGLPVSYASDNLGTASIDENGVVTITYYGLVTIQASQAGNEYYNAADDAYQQLLIYYSKPTQNTYGLEVSSSDVRSLSVAYNPGDGAGRLLVMKESAPVNLMPEVNTFYSPAQNINGNIVISAENSSGALLENLHDGSTYYFAVYEFNWDGAGAISYRTEDAPTASYLIPALGPAYVTVPVNNALNQKLSVAVTSIAVAKAMTYTIELNTSADFTGTAIVKSGGRNVTFTGLQYGTQYFSRVKTNLSPNYGEVKSFTTATPDYFAYVVTPVNGATGLTTSVAVTANKVDLAATYEIELNTSSDFNGAGKVYLGTSRMKTFTGLSYNTTYYTRVRTSLTDTWGETRSFTTVNAQSLAYVTSPMNNSTNNIWTLDITSSNVVGATTYWIQVSKDNAFNTGVITSLPSSTRTIKFTGLDYDSHYYTRVATNVSGGAYGTVRSFFTGNPVSRSFVVDPANNATGVSTKPSISSGMVPGAKTYTIELNTDPGFNPATAKTVSASTRFMSFKNLLGNTLYYARVRTSLVPGVWGPTKSFTTKALILSRSRTNHDDAVNAGEVLPNAFAVEVLSNPFKNKLSFVIKSPLHEDAKVQLIDLNGKTIHEAVEGTNRQIDIDKQMNNGIYILHIRTRENYKAVRVVRMD
jgi:hypothetical protein